MLGDRKVLINKNNNNLEIMMPSWLFGIVVAFMVVFLIVMMFGVVGFTIGVVSGGYGSHQTIGFYLFAIAIVIYFAIGALIVICYILWGVIGYETITIIKNSKRSVIFSQRVVLFGKNFEIKKKYSLDDCKNFRLTSAAKIETTISGSFNRPINTIFNIPDPIGLIAFDYGSKISYFGSGINSDDAEAVIKEINLFIEKINEK